MSEKKAAYAIKGTSQRICFTTLASRANPEIFRPISDIEKVQAAILYEKGCSQKVKDCIKLTVMDVFLSKPFCLFLKRILSQGHPPFAKAPGVPFLTLLQKSRYLSAFP